MKIHFRTVLVSTAALAITGGAAFAYISATSVSGSGSATTTSVATSLSLYTSPTAPAINPIAGTPNTVPVLADNTGSVALRVPSTATVVVTTPGAPTCPPNSFTATFAGNGADIPPAPVTGTAAGQLTVSFVNSTTVDQSACNGAALTFTFSTSS